MRVIDANFVHSSAADMALLRAELSGKAAVSFTDLRSNVAAFSTLTDGELAQIAQDAGFEVDDG